MTSTLGLCASVGFLCSSPKWTNLISIRHPTMNEPTRAHNKDENVTRSPMARREPPWHERTTALDNSMEPADRTEIAPTGPSEVAEPLCAARARRDVSCAPLEEIHESVVRATEYLRLQLSWDCGPTMEDRLVTLHNDIDEALGTYALCAERNVSKLTELRNHLAWLLGDNLLEGAFDYDSDDYQDDYEDTWDDETTWGKGSTTTPTTATGGVQLITTPPQLVTTPPHVFRFGSPAPPEAIHVDAGKSAMTLNYPADECADSTADDRAFAEHRADFTAKPADSTPTTVPTPCDDRADLAMGDDGPPAAHGSAQARLEAVACSLSRHHRSLSRRMSTRRRSRSRSASKSRRARCGGCARTRRNCARRRCSRGTRCRSPRARSSTRSRPSSTSCKAGCCCPRGSSARTRSTRAGSASR